MAHGSSSPLDFGIGALFWQIPEAVIVADGATGQIVLWNPAAEAMFGYTSEEMVGRDVEVIIPPQHRAAHHHGMHRFHETGHGPLIDARKPVELPALRRDGTQLTVELSLSPTTGPDGVAYAMAVVRDVTARKASERALQQQAQLLDLAHDAIIVRELHSRKVTYWNRGAERLFGFTRAEVLGRDLVDLLRPLAPVDAIQPTLEQDGAWSGELALRHRDGDTRHVQARMTVQTGAESPEPVVLELLIDVGDRKHAAQELQRAYRELMELDRYKDEFLSVISHELRTPLNFIMGFSSLLQDEVVGPLNPQQLDYMGKILNGADRMLMLVNDLLDFAKLQAGKFDMDCHPTPYAPLVMDVVATMEPLAEDKDIRLRTEVDVPMLPYLDGPRVIQVLTNLLSNAIKFTPAHGEVHITARVEGQELVTEVTDTGLGIEEQDLPKVFEKFKQLDMTATRQAGGTGLGLSISKALVEAHGGQIGVTSVPGQGSTFWYRLPLVQGDS
ncbi:MAG: sensor signal transduction histidine kinase [Cyanobacteria bacterium RYN_339]|nr:sensor signal transduction histidine kinase [Cyanobacteria bacterium RYN_339]